MDLHRLGEAIKGEGNAQLLKAWLGWRGQRQWPRRSDVNLADIAPILPWVGLLEVLDNDDARLRVAGSALREIYGMELTGKSLRAITTPEDWPERSHRFHAQVGQPCGSFYVRRDVLPNGRTVVYEAVGLPIGADDAGSRRHMLFSVVALDTSFVLEAPTGAHQLPMPSEYRHVDIGAGLPPPRQ